MDIDCDGTDWQCPYCLSSTFADIVGIQMDSRKRHMGIYQLIMFPISLFQMSLCKGRRFPKMRYRRSFVMGQCTMRLWAIQTGIPRKS